MWGTACPSPLRAERTRGLSIFWQGDKVPENRIDRHRLCAYNCLSKILIEVNAWACFNKTSPFVHEKSNHKRLSSRCTWQACEETFPRLGDMHDGQTPLLA